MMKNKIFLSMVFALVLLLGFSSCKDVTTEGVTRITYYPVINITGDATVYIAKGATYTDAGASAIENGKEVTLKTTSTVDTSTPGTYAVSYTATNADGFTKTAKRTVIVYDSNMSTTDLSGTYQGHVIRNADPNKEYSGNPVTLSASGIPGTTGIYEISDWIAGFYNIGYGYGTDYQFPGLIQINGKNEVIELSMSNPWGDPFDSVSGTYDPSTGTISYHAYWLTGTYDFAVDLTK